MSKCVPVLRGGADMVNNPKEGKFLSRDVNRDRILVQGLGRVSLRN